MTERRRDGAEAAPVIGPDRPADGAGGPGDPLVLGTAGHIDHGKTALVRALTGVDTDRLPQERERGISIELGYAPLVLPSGRALSVVDVPGHERFVRTMVAGATGIDLYLMVVAADDGVMPQTREHAAVLRALGVAHGVVAVTKADLADPQAALSGAAELLPDAEAVVCSARTGEGIAAVAAALDRVAARLPGRAGAGGEPILHVDRAFTVKGVGTVVTGTLWSGAIARGDELVVLRAGAPLRARVRGVQVHDAPVERVAAGRRVALNLAGVAVRDIRRGDVVAGPGADLAPSWILDARLDLRDAAHGQRVQVHHGTREAPGRLADLGDGIWQLRLEQPLLARRGDRVVVRSIAPPDTLGGGTVLDPRARKRGRARAQAGRAPAGAPGRPDAAGAGDGRGRGAGARGAGGRGRARGDAAAPAGDRAAGGAGGRAPAAPEPPSPEALALAERLRAAGHEPPTVAQLGDDARHLPALVAAGLAVRVGRDRYAHPDALAAVRARVEAICAAEGSITLARLRDELGTSRTFAQAFLERLDADHVTIRRPDDTRTLRRRRRAAEPRGGAA
jgi:selenocysteine-specific elongation factor